MHMASSYWVQPTITRRHSLVVRCSTKRASCGKNLTMFSKSSVTPKTLDAADAFGSVFGAVTSGMLVVDGGGDGGGDGVFEAASGGVLADASLN